MIWILPLFGILLIILDQWVKYWAHEHLRPISSRTVLSGWFDLTYVENQGAAFGLLQGARWFFVILTVVMLAAVTVYYIKLPHTRESFYIRIPLVLIFAGAIGNFIDRFRNGYVIDMFEFTFIRFPVFNVADICLVTGTLILAFMLLFIVKEPQK